MTQITIEASREDVELIRWIGEGDHSFDFDEWKRDRDAAFDLASRIEAALEGEGE